MCVCVYVYIVSRYQAYGCLRVLSQVHVLAVKYHPTTRDITANRSWFLILKKHNKYHKT